MNEKRTYTPTDTELYLELTHHWIDRTILGCHCGYRYFDHPSQSEHAEHVARAVLDKFEVRPRRLKAAPPSQG